MASKVLDTQLRCWLWAQNWSYGTTRFLGSGCGSVTVLVEEGKIDTANPGLYPRGMKCHWLIEGPAEYVVKLQLEDFAVEFSLSCIYDAVTIYWITARILCSGFVSVGEQDSCQGDGSGGPLVCSIADGPFTLDSTVRWGGGGASPKKAGACSRTERNLSNCHGQLMVCEGSGLTKELLGERELTLMLG
ncbi:LOW QUALITY PROTEIN: ovochymase-1 [Geothlypis trichas]